jgi:hypothetical protein
MVYTNHPVMPSAPSAVCAWPAVGGRLSGPLDGNPFLPLTQAEKVCCS